MRVLVAESDRDLGTFLKRGLQNEGHLVEVTSDAESIVEYARSEYPDLIVLDSGTQNEEPHSILKQIRAEGSDAAAFVLTVRTDPRERAEILDAGADDCLLKPFSFLEFTARCRALLRRRAQAADPVLRHEDVELRRVHRQVLRGGKEISLTVKEFALLEYLMLRRGETVSRGELLEHVWKTEEDTGTNIVDVYINYLRRKLEADEGSAEIKLIQTVRGTGYRIGGAVQTSKRALGRAFLASTAPASSRPTLLSNAL